VFVKSSGTGENWLPGSHKKRTGPVSFLAKLKNGSERHCHQDQIRSRTVQEENVPENTTVEEENPF